jgi:hypothetical protein
MATYQANLRDRRPPARHSRPVRIWASHKEALRLIRGDGDKFVDRIMNGSQIFTGSIDPDETDMWVGLVPADLVQQGAWMLAGVNAEALFANDAVHVLEDFEYWQDLYRDAAAHGDAILVGACP